MEFGVGERLLVRVLARASGATAASVTRRFKQVGDLGLVAEVLTRIPPDSHSRLTLSRAYAGLLSVARASGSGAGDRKIGILAELLSRATPLEARYLVRIVQGRLRLGLGDATILEAAAAGALGDRRKRPLIEQAYNVRSDLGRVIRLAYAGGGRGLATGLHAGFIVPSGFGCYLAQADRGSHPDRRYRPRQRIAGWHVLRGWKPESSVAPEMLVRAGVVQGRATPAVFGVAPSHRLFAPFDHERDLRVGAVLDDLVALHLALEVLDPDRFDSSNRLRDFLDGVAHRVVEALLGLGDDFGDLHNAAHRSLLVTSRDSLARLLSLLEFSPRGRN